MTVKEFLEEIETALRKAGIGCAAREAVLLACHVLSVDQVYLYTHKDEYIDEKVLLGAAALVNERCKGRPLAYIMGTAGFCGLDITVDERVLIPRPETELLVEEVVKLGKGDIRVLDLCTGSGCIAAAVAAELPLASVTASDLSLRALQLARYNLKAYENVKVIRSDLFEGIEESFDVIVSNPPYVALRDREELQREVKDFEPEMALFAGEDGLEVIKKILKSVGDHLVPGGMLFMEIGDTQGDEVRRLAEETEVFGELSVEKDLAGLDRYLKAKKK